jgi:hypothetical protein
MADSPATIMNAHMSLLSQPIGNNKRNIQSIARIRNIKNVEKKFRSPTFFLQNFSMKVLEKFFSLIKVLEKLPLCKKIPHEKSYFNNLNDNQYIDHLRFFVFLTVHGYLMIFGDANLTVQSLA